MVASATVGATAIPQINSVNCPPNQERQKGAGQSKNHSAMRVHVSPCSGSDTIGILRTRAYCGSSPSALASAWTAWTLSSVKHPIRQSGSSRVSDGANRRLNCPDRGTIGGSGANRDYRMSAYDKALRPHSALRLRLQSAKLRAWFGTNDAGGGDGRTMHGIDMSGWRALIKGYFAALRLIVGAVMSSAC
jgi:hypothetical protein